MSALWHGRWGAPSGALSKAGELRALLPMTVAHLDAVSAIESAAYAFPWSRGNFVDSLAAGYPARVLYEGPRLIGYFVAMRGVDEMHLLNVAVAPAMQRRGAARLLIGALIELCREESARQLWLEVRASNARARALYERIGFVQAGVRKGYYPAPFGRREDAVVMRLETAAAAPGVADRDSRTKPDAVD